MAYPRMARVLPGAAAALIVSPGPRSAGSAGAAARLTGAAALKPTAYLAMCYTDKVGVMNAVTDTFSAYIQVGDCPDAMAITPNDKDGLRRQLRLAHDDRSRPRRTRRACRSPWGRSGRHHDGAERQDRLVTLTDDGTM
jgi:hypothetical protein